LWLQGRGHELLVLADQSGLCTEGIAPSATDTVPARWVLRSYWDGNECLYPPFREALAIEQNNLMHLRQAITDLQPHAVLFWHMGSISLGLITSAARLGLPFVCVVGDDWLCYGGWSDAWLRRFSYHPHRQAAVTRLTGLPTRLPDIGALGAFCFVSKCLLERAERIGGWRFARAKVTYPGVSSAEFPPMDMVAGRSWTWQVLWVGRVVESKGIETAIRALPLLPQEASLAVVGPVPPDYLAFLQTLATALGVAERIQFNHASRLEIRAHYQAADVTLFTSAIEHEGFGLVPLEAMAAGCPVIATGVGGSGEYCADHYNCLRIPPGDAQALAAAIGQLAANPQLRGNLITGGLRTAAAFTLDTFASAIERAVLEEIAYQEDPGP
jgi:glycosyltransferase involved in cell wall biosynthesis